MWPWEHLAFGYLVYSLSLRAVGRRPRGGPTLLLLLGTQLPDLIDKPLGWQFGVFRTGVGAAHSVLVVGPLLLILLVWAVRADRTRYALAFATGHLSHVFADVINPIRNGDGLAVGKALWPVVRYPPYEQNLDLFGRFLYYFGEFLAQALRPEHAAVIGLYGLLFVIVGLLWVADGAPGVGTVLRAVGLGGPRSSHGGS